MRITESAAAIINVVDDPIRKASVIYYAEELARAQGRDAITKADAEAAILVAGPEFLPESEGE